MLIRGQAPSSRQQGMTLVELILSATIFGVVVAGSTASALLFAKIAADHENRSDFGRDIRNGMEMMSFDVRNASKVSARYNERFDLTFPDGRSVRYHWDNNTGVVARRQDGVDQQVFKNVSNFDVLRNAADQPSGDDLTFAEDEISIEEIVFGASSGTSGGTSYNLTNITFKLRNG